MKDPIRYRQEIPLYYDKSASEFRLDPYERYDSMVLRQSMIHLSNSLWDNYTGKGIQNYIQDNWPRQIPNDILEIGCGVGRLIGDIAQKYPDSNCWGIDYSYQMLKRAKEAWVESKSFYLDGSKFGFGSNIHVGGKSIKNLNFGLAKCESLPFDDHSQDIVFSSFLLDRLEDPIQGLKEMKRILRKDGVLIVISPLNFGDSANWSRFFPVQKLKREVEDLGFTVSDWNNNLNVKEFLDRRGNCVSWNCVGMVLS